MVMQDKRQSIQITVLPSGIMQFNTPAGGFDFDPSGCSDETERQATIKGYKEKISNKAAMPAGTPWSVKLAAMKEVAERLASGGAWNERGASAFSLDRASLFAAVALVRKLDPAQVALKWQDKPDEVLRVALSHADVAAEYARLTSKGVQDDSLFEGLED